MDQMRGDNKRNQQVSSKQLSKQVLGMLGDTIFALIVGVLCLFVLGGVVGAIWHLIA